jgi:hypothetical protein
MSMPIDEASAKVRDGGPHDAAADLSAPVWAGVIPLVTVTDSPIAATDYSGAAKPPLMTHLAPRRQRRKP